MDEAGIEGGVTDRLTSGKEVEVRELFARMDELENGFEERGFVYVAVNGWLITGLDDDREALELMLLRGVCARLEDGRSGRVVLVDRHEVDDDAEVICEFNERYVPDGCLCVAPSPEAVPSVRP